MLKIRDDVDLKELEKFGFEYWESDCGSTGYSIETEYGHYTIIEKDEEHLGNKFWERKIITGINYCLLYDLIKADLVEKIED